jgi:hypothetical protein
VAPTACPTVSRQSNTLDVSTVMGTHMEKQTLFTDKSLQTRASLAMDKQQNIFQFLKKNIEVFNK